MTGARGPKSKPSAIRRNKPKPTTRLEAAKAKPPALLGDFSVATLNWWEAWVGSPQSEFFAATDWQTLLRLAPLVDLYFKKPTPQLAAEIRQTEAKLGATAADRDRLGWKIEPPGETGAAEAPAADSRARPDPRRKPT